MCFHVSCAAKRISGRSRADFSYSDYSTHLYNWIQLVTYILSKCVILTSPTGRRTYSTYSSSLFCFHCTPYYLLIHINPINPMLRNELRSNTLFVTTNGYFWGLNRWFTERKSCILKWTLKITQTGHQVGVGFRWSNNRKLIRQANGNQSQRRSEFAALSSSPTPTVEIYLK